MNIVRVVMTIVLAVALAVFAIFLVSNAGTNNATEWERWVYVFGAAEALAFTAIGWLFGREVNRQRAETAETRADQAEREKTSAREDGAKLAGLVVAGATAEGSSQARLRLGSQGPSGSADHLKAAVDFARQTYGL